MHRPTYRGHPLDRPRVSEAPGPPGKVVCVPGWESGLPTMRHLQHTEP